MNRSDLLGEHRNKFIANLIGGLVVIIVTALGVFKLVKVFAM